MTDDTNTYTSEKGGFNESYQSLILLAVIGICIFGLVFCLIKSSVERWSALKLSRSFCIWISDAIFDWMLIIQWYQTGNKSWASWILAAILVGGYISAETLRKREAHLREREAQKSEGVAEISNIPWKTILFFCIDFLGFSHIRTFKEEVLLQAKSTDKENSQDIKDLLDLSLCIHIGGIVESLMSFTVVGYCIILETVANHEDVTTPSMLEYLTWMSSYFGILFKILIFMEADEKWKELEDSDPLEQTIESPQEKSNKYCQIGLTMAGNTISLWFMTNCNVLPAFILAQNINKVSIPMCPDFISSEIGLSYLPSMMLFTFVFVRIFYMEKTDNPRVEIPSILFVDLCSVWIVVTQIWIQFYGEFNSKTGKAICFFWTVGAFMRILQTIWLLVRCVVRCEGKYEIFCKRKEQKEELLSKVRVSKHSMPSLY